MNAMLPPRARATVLFAAVGAAVLIGGGAAYGWASAASLSPIIAGAALVLWLLAGRDSDAGAVARGQTDERQAGQRLHVQAFVGRLLSLAVAVAYLIAVATKTTLWPYAVLLGVVAAGFAAGWWFYGEHGPGSRGSAEDPPARRRSVRR
jgi:hypothetical protein